MKLKTPTVPIPRKGLSTAIAVLFASVFFNSCKKEISPTVHEPQNIAAAALNKSQAVDMQLIASGLSSPLGVEEAPDGSGRLFIFDQVGKIWIVDANGNLLSTPFLDISSRMVALRPGFDERGLIGFTFHPQYATNGRFFVHYQAPPNPGGPTPSTSWNNLSRLAEFRVSSDPNIADASSERVIIEWNDPQFNHNGGTVAFGPDGYLYISIGDGGGANDVGPGHAEDWYAANQGGNAQNIEANWFGKILRISVTASGNPTYTVPADNPFTGKPGRDEIWAYGLRNPYRFSIDMGGNRDIIAGDAGQVLYEEINLIRRGGNYGWNVKEGRACFNAANNLTTLPDCPAHDIWGNKLQNPVITMNHFRNPDGGGRLTTIIGGNVYRGTAIPSLVGKYIFGSFSQPGGRPAELFVAKMPGTGDGQGQWPHEELTLASRPSDIGYFLKGFGQDLEGEIYLTVSGTAAPSGTLGKVFKLVPAQ